MVSIICRNYFLMPLLALVMGVADYSIVIMHVRGCRYIGGSGLGIVDCEHPIIKYFGAVLLVALYLIEAGIMHELVQKGAEYTSLKAAYFTGQYASLSAVGAITAAVVVCYLFSRIVFLETIGRHYVAFIVIFLIWGISELSLYGMWVWFRK